jgi:nitrate reductase NapAB chaperone NapD
MAVSGLVVTVDQARAAAVADTLRADPRFTLGPLQGSRLPVVVETAGVDEDDEVWAWLHSIPGVRFVDVAYVHFETGDGNDNAR